MFRLPTETSIMKRWFFEFRCVTENALLAEKKRAIPIVQLSAVRERLGSERNRADLLPELQCRIRKAPVGATASRPGVLFQTRKGKRLGEPVLQQPFEEAWAASLVDPAENISQKFESFVIGHEIHVLRNPQHV